MEMAVKAFQKGRFFQPYVQQFALNGSNNETKRSVQFRHECCLA